MSTRTHAWSLDPVGQAAIRRAEDGRTDPVPTLEQLFAAVPWMVSEEVIAHSATLDKLAETRESLAAANRGITRLTAERDAAIRERDEARAEAEHDVREILAFARKERDAALAEASHHRDRVAELESAVTLAQDANAGGVSNQPHGWLTAEDHRAVAFAAKAMRGHAIAGNLKEIADQLESLLARSTPPRVKKPEYQNHSRARDCQWIAAIREAGVEVAE